MHICLVIFTSIFKGRQDFNDIGGNETCFDLKAILFVQNS